MTTTGEAFAFYAWLQEQLRTEAYIGDHLKHGWDCYLCRKTWRLMISPV